VEARQFNRTQYAGQQSSCPAALSSLGARNCAASVHTHHGYALRPSGVSTAQSARRELHSQKEGKSVTHATCTAAASKVAHVATEHFNLA
jgi:hypothetical protein